MECHPVSDRSLHNLQQLIADSRSRGEDCFAALLEGIQMYVAMGREIELLETMLMFERGIRPAVEGTPSATQLEDLYRRTDPSK